jgi:hypothetical protein
VLITCLHFFYHSFMSVQEFIAAEWNARSDIIPLSDWTQL